MSHFWHFNNRNSKSKYDNQSSIRWSISFPHLKTFKIQFLGPPFCIMFWSVECTFTCQRHHFQLFLYIKFAQFWYITGFFTNLIPKYVGTSPTGTSPKTILRLTLSRQTLPRRTFPWTDISPNGQFPERTLTRLDNFRDLIFRDYLVPPFLVLGVR